MHCKRYDDGFYFEDTREFQNCLTLHLPQPPCQSTTNAKMTKTCFVSIYLCLSKRNEPGIMPVICTERTKYKNLILSPSPGFLHTHSLQKTENNMRHMTFLFLGAVNQNERHKFVKSWVFHTTDTHIYQR